MGDFRIWPLLNSASDMILFWASEQFTNSFQASRVPDLKKNFIFQDSRICAVYE